MRPGGNCGGSFMNSDQTIIELGQKALFIESSAIRACAERLGSSFATAVRMIQKTTSAGGRVVVTGLGKSGHAGAKIASTFASTGTPSFFLHASEALHGDFGMIGSRDLILAIAYGGQTREVLAVCQYAKESGHLVIGITGAVASGLSELSDCILDGWVDQEADALGLAPTASTSVTLGIGDALASVLMSLQGFTEEHFARLHPGGSLGRSLMTVNRVMKSRRNTPAVKAIADFHQVLESVTSPNFGIVCVVDAEDRVLGSVTDGDLRRALLQHDSKALLMTAGELMNPDPRMISPDERAVGAAALMEKYQITSLFVVSSGQILLGLVRLHDLMSEKLL